MQADPEATPLGGESMSDEEAKEDAVTVPVLTIPSRSKRSRNLHLPSPHLHLHLQPPSLPDTRALPRTAHEGPADPPPQRP